MKRKTAGPMTLILVLATVFLSSGLATAQDRGGRRAGGFLVPPQRLLEHLGVTEDQSIQINALGERFKAASESFHAERRNLHEQLEAEFQSGSPDPAVVGSLVISQRDLAQRQRTIQGEYRADFQSLLTVEQQEELEEMRTSRRHGRRGSRRGFRGDREDSPEVL